MQHVQIAEERNRILIRSKIIRFLRVLVPRMKSGTDCDTLPAISATQDWAVPETDLINEAFDFQDDGTPDKMLLLLSTPRSGSTYLSELLKILGFGVPHEYFQPHQYMQLLNDRWNFADPRSGKINWDIFAERIRRKRTSNNGWLSINLHGSHLDRFDRAKNHFNDLKVTTIHLRRHDLISQALSLCEARATRKWSTNFEPAGQWAYDFETTFLALDELLDQDLKIDTWLKHEGLSAREIWFEDFIKDIAGNLAAITSLDVNYIERAIEKNSATVKRQSDQNSREALKKQFSADLERFKRRRMSQRLEGRSTPGSDG